jgi:uncharacterized delta-60 repeat protein
MAVLPDGGLLIGGAFTAFGDQPMRAARHVARLSPGGALDGRFSPNIDGTVVYNLTLQPDDKILVGGAFGTIAATPRLNIARLEADGALDSEFNPEANGSVYCQALQADGKILVGGAFTSLGGQARSHLGRLNPDGTLDGSFNPRPNGDVLSIAVQADGRILAAGSFTTMLGQPRNGLARLNANGTLDTAFNANVSGGASALGLQDDGKILVGGSFGKIGGQARRNLARLNNTVPATQNLSLKGSAITWLRGGTSPEIYAASFEASTNETDWAFLGFGTRIAGGWQLTNAIIQGNARIRARGLVAGGLYNGSSWFVEAISGPPLLITQPKGVTVDPGDTAVLRVVVSGTPPLSFQWMKDGADIAGATGSSLTVANIQSANTGTYTVRASNVLGTATSAPATITLNRATVDSFNPVNESDDPNTYIQAVAFYPDGRLLVGGRFNSLSGSAQTNLVRLLPDGTLDAAFHCEALKYHVDSLAIREDGKIIAGASFRSLGGQSGVGELNADGTLAGDFKVVLAGGYVVDCLLEQQDGKILVGGSFTNHDGQVHANLLRLNPDGTVDNSFTPKTDGVVYANAVHPSGGIFVGGDFSHLNGAVRRGLAMINPDGSLVQSFDPDTVGIALSLIVQPDGKILGPEVLDTVNGRQRYRIVRLNSDGTRDLDFALPEIDAGGLTDMTLQTDGRILISGRFLELGGQLRRSLARLNADGTLDTSFNPKVDDSVWSVTVQPD